MRVAGVPGTLWFTIIVWFTHLLSLSASVDVYSRFRVQMGLGPITRTDRYTGGSCEGLDVDMQAVYNEAIDMAAVSIEAINSYATDKVIRATLKSFFGIQPDSADPTLVAAESISLLNTVRNTFQGIIDDSHNTHNGLNPGLFCSDKWAWKTRWLYNMRTGRRTGKLLTTVKAPSPLWWTPLYKRYVGGINSITCTGTVLAYTTFGDATSITFCPQSFEWPKRKDSLAPWKGEDPERKIVEGKPMKLTMSTAGTFLHELCHLVFRECLDKKVDGEVAYGPDLVILLAAANPHDAVLNADSYRWFANAMYINSIDWSRGISAMRDDKKKLAQRSNDSIAVNDDDHGPLKRGERILGGPIIHS
ncbi:hypothetical protein MferCBS31731_001552 [Microsporum ferrugineum]